MIHQTPLLTSCNNKYLYTEYSTTILVFRKKKSVIQYTQAKILGLKVAFFVNGGLLCQSVTQS
jgi:hypothetical protein